METFVPMLAAAGVIYALSNFVKLALAGDWDHATTLLTTWIIGVVVTFVLAMTDFADSIRVGEEWVLGDLNAWSLILVGFAAAGVGNVIYDALPGASTPTFGGSNDYEDRIGHD